MAQSENDDAASLDEDDAVEWYPGLIFEPLPPPDVSHATRASSNIIYESQYRDLSNYDFTAEERAFAANYIINSAEQNDGPIGSRGFARRYNLKSPRVQTWVDKLKGKYGEAGKVFHETQGRPFSIDDEGIEKISSTLRAGRNLKKSVLNAKAREVISLQQHETAARRNQMPPARQLHKKTIIRVRKRTGVSCVRAQEMTECRVKAASDVRNAFTLYVMLLAFAKALWSCMIFNWDAVTFEIKKEGAKFVWYIKDPNDNTPVTASGTSELPMGIKWIPIISADGAISRIVLVVAIDSFAPDTFEKYPIKGLTCSNGRQSPPGWLCFCRTRAGNKQFWNWFMTEIVIPEVQDARSGDAEYAPPRLPDNTIMPAMILIDGEAVWAAAVHFLIVAIINNSKWHDTVIKIHNIRSCTIKNQVT